MHALVHTPNSACVEVRSRPAAGGGAPQQPAKEEPATGARQLGTAMPKPEETQAGRRGPELSGILLKRADTAGDWADHLLNQITRKKATELNAAHKATLATLRAELQKAIGPHALLLGNALPLFIFEILYAYAVGYVLFWLVMYADGKDYKLVAICLYVVYSLINIVAAMSSLVLVIPAVFFFLKTIASLSCAFYSFKIREGTGPAGSVPLHDEEVAE